jgi:sugar phosphate isomerase/epimerase
MNSLIQYFWVPILSFTVSMKWLNEEKTEEILLLAQHLWVQLITFSPPHFTDKNIEWFTRYLSQRKKYYNISIAVQNVETKFRFFIIPEYKNATLSEIKKITWDTTLDLSLVDNDSGMDIIKAQKNLGNSLKNVFLNDKFWLKVGLLPWTLPGNISYLPIESFLMQLKTNGYNGFITIKVKPSELWVWNEEKILENLKNIKNYYCKYFLYFNV